MYLWSKKTGDFRSICSLLVKNILCSFVDKLLRLIHKQLKLKDLSLKPTDQFK